MSPSVYRMIPQFSVRIFLLKIGSQIVFYESLDTVMHTADSEPGHGVF